MRKLRERKGETLAETLCAVLVLALAVALLAAMVSATLRLDRKTEQFAGKLYDAFSKAEKPQGSGTDGTVTVKIGEETANINVEFYGSGEQAASYRTKKPGGAP